MDSDVKRGLYGKFLVERHDGSSARGKKHEHCRYFVLDMDHDPHARAALEAYAKSCAEEYPKLAKDLRGMLKRKPPCGCRSAGHELGCMGLDGRPQFRR